MKITEEYGLYIKGKRTEKGLTQAEVAKALGISQQAYARYELGQRELTLPLIVNIANAIGYDPGEFFDRFCEVG